MKMLATLAAAAGVAIATPIPGLVSAQAPARITSGEFAVETVPAPAPAVKLEVRKADAPKVEAPAAKQEVRPEVEKFLRDFLPQFAPPPVKTATGTFTVERPGNPGAVQPGARLVPAPVNVEAMARQANEQLRVQMNARPAMPQVNVEAMSRQMTEQFRPVFRAELRLLTSAAGPSPEQRRAIAIDGGRAAREAGRKFAEYQAEINQNGRVQGTMPDARKMIRDAFAASAQARLSPDQAARYRAEVDARAKDQRQVIVLNLVASLDNLLILGPDQREKLCESLVAHWNDRVYPTLETLTNYDGYFPNIPDEAIIPCLDERQRTTWRGVRKVSFGQSMSFGGGMRANAGDVDEDEKAAFAEEPKP